MLTKKGIIYLVGAIFLMLLIAGAVFFIRLIASFPEEKVTITKDFVINPNWVGKDDGITVTKMKLKDSSDIINLKNVSPSDLLQKLVKDTSFDYFANVKYNGVEFSKRKVYFNRDNGFIWLGDEYGRKPTKRILGQLKPKTWYLLGDLSNIKTLYYVYADSFDSFHSFRVG